MLEIRKFKGPVLSFAKGKKILLILVLTFSQSCYSLNIIFDLGGVLLDVNKTYMASKVGPCSFLMYMISLNNPLSIKTRLFETLAKIPATGKNEFSAGDDNGKVLPDIMCDWLSGKKTSTEIKNLAANFLENNQEFYNATERQLLAKIIDIMFTPEHLINSNEILQEGLNFVKKCKESGHKIFILSNWDLESSFLLTKKYPELFDLFYKDGNGDGKNIVFSGQVGLIKPDPRIYQYIVGKNNLDPHECIFFDDQKINVESAKKFGIHAVVCKNAKCTDMVRELNAFTKQVASRYLYPENSN